MDDCLFCKMAKGEIPYNLVYEDGDLLAIYDIYPQAPVHVICFPKEHVADSADDINEQNAHIAAKIFAAIPKICASLGVENGYRVVTNIGQDGGQTINHLHFHILAKKPLALTFA